MILATLETPNFTFTGLAKTQPEAERMIKAYWRVHCETTGADLNYFDIDAVRFDSINFGEVLCR
jgi:hypothetical protein|tara:strand:+ start:122 stop:313 length:192 start_codon:yes stop_codon:yes gene_type:complete